MSRHRADYFLALLLDLRTYIGGREQEGVVSPQLRSPGKAEISGAPPRTEGDAQARHGANIVPLDYPRSRPTRPAPSSARSSERGHRSWPFERHARHPPWLQAALRAADDRNGAPYANRSGTQQVPDEWIIDPTDPRTPDHRHFVMTLTFECICRSSVSRSGRCRRRQLASGCIAGAARRKASICPHAASIAANLGQRARSTLKRRAPSTCGTR